MVLDSNLKGSSLKRHVPQFPHLEKSDNNNGIHFIESLWRLNDIMHGNHWAAFYSMSVFPIRQLPPLKAGPCWSHSQPKLSTRFFTAVSTIVLIKGTCGSCASCPWATTNTDATPATFWYQKIKPQGTVRRRKLIRSIAVFTQISWKRLPLVHD